MSPINAPDFWQMAKRIDGYPDSECSFPVFSARAAALEGRIPRSFYEYASSFDDVVGMLRMNSLFGTGTSPTRNAYTVGLGLEWFDSGFHTLSGRLCMPHQTDPFRGRHHVMVIGFDLDADELLILNPWSTWGEDGRGFVPRAYFDAHVDEVFVTRSAAIGPSLAFADHLLAVERAGEDPATRQAILDAWATPNPEDLETIGINGTNHVLSRSTTLSFDGCFVDVLELTTQYRRVGRCHVKHTGDGLSLVTELFVMPRFRRRGYATVLEERAVDLAREAESTSLRALVYEADARPRVLRTAEGFFSSTGYSWSQVSRRRPNVQFIATREI